MEKKRLTAVIVAMNLHPELMNVVVCLKAYTESADPRDMESPPPFLTSDSVL